ncbi:MAG: tetratricopeptide repeat protein [Anaerolineales bacterium]
MKNRRRFSLIIRVLLPLILISLLGISSHWRGMQEALQIARQANEAGDSIKASQNIFQAIQYSPWREDLWELAGILSLNGGDEQNARKYLQQGDQSGCLSASGLTALGDAAQLADDPQSAVLHWEEALEAGGTPAELHSRLAETYRQLGDFDIAIQHQSELVRINPTDPESNYTLGLMLAASKPESAIAYLTLAAELDPNLSENTTAVTQNIRSARIRNDQAHLLVSSGQALASIEEWDLAVIALSRATELNPEYADAWAYLGEALHQMGQEGSEQIERALTVDPNSLAANILMGLYWQREEQYDMALVYLHAAAQLDDNNPAIQVEIGNTLGLLGNLSAAEAHYQGAVEISPRDPVYWQSLANFYIKYESKLSDEGLPAAREAVILDPSDPTSLDMLGQIYLLLDSPHIARRFIQRALDIDPNFLPANLHLGLIHILDGDTLQAYQRFKLVQSLAPNDSQISEQARRLLETHFP